jgi:hypothetical protein
MKVLSVAAKIRIAARCGCGNHMIPYPITGVPAPVFDPRNVNLSHLSALGTGME